MAKDPLLAWSTSLSEGQASVVFRATILTLDRCSKESLCNAGERVFDRWVAVLEQLYDRFLAAFWLWPAVWDLVWLHVHWSSPRAVEEQLEQWPGQRVRGKHLGTCRITKGQVRYRQWVPVGRGLTSRYYGISLHRKPISHAARDWFWDWFWDWEKAEKKRAEKNQVRRKKHVQI